MPLHRRYTAGIIPPPLTTHDRWRTSRRSTHRYVYRYVATAAFTVTLPLHARQVEDIKKVYTLFVDVKRSTQFLIEYQNEFMFSEIQDADADMTDAKM